VAAAALGVLALAAFGIAMAFQVRTTTRERERAERVSDFLVGLFSIADPGLARGNSITAREVLDRGAKQLQRELKNDPLTQARLLETMGFAYMGLGLYAKAEELYGRAVELRRTALGEEHPLTLRSRLEEAYALLRLSRIDEAQKRLTELTPVLRRVLGEEHPDTLQSLDNYATTLEEQGRNAEAAPIYRRVLEARLRVLGKDNRSTIWSEQNVGFNLLAQGNAATSPERERLFAESEKMLREAVVGFERLLGPDHPDTLWTRRNLVQNLETQNRLSEAESMQRAILETSRRVLGPDHVTSHAGEHLLARILAEEKRYDESETLFRQSLDGARRTLGQDHSRTLHVMIELATTLYVPRGNYAKAEPLLREAYESATRTRDDLSRLDAAYNLGCLNALRGDRPAALDWLRKSVEAGFSDAAGMSTDNDLASLRSDPGFERLLAAMRSKAPPVKAMAGNQP
jgi:eukaryotic-like serine/threonine-protein kinase